MEGDNSFPEVPAYVSKWDKRRDRRRLRNDALLYALQESIHDAMLVIQTGMLFSGRRNASLRDRDGKL